MRGRCVSHIYVDFDKSADIFTEKNYSVAKKLFLVEICLSCLGKHKELYPNIKKDDQ